jgi:phage FluMu protein Com
MDVTFNCRNCGQSIACDADMSGLEVQCPTCQASMTVPRDYDVSAVTPPRKSVGGWLLFFCISLTILFPLRSLIAFADIFTFSVPLFPRYTFFAFATGIDVLLRIALTIFSIYTGIALWQRRTGAVKLAKHFLYCWLGYSGVLIVLQLLFIPTMPQFRNSTALGIILIEIAKGIFFFAIWFAYLTKSRRVKETFDSSTENRSNDPGFETEKPKAALILKLSRDEIAVVAIFLRNYW